MLNEKSKCSALFIKGSVTMKKPHLWGYYVKTQGSTVPTLRVVTKWVRCWQTDLADAPRTSIDVKATICEDLCTGQTTTTMLVGHTKPSPVPQTSGTATNVMHCHAGPWLHWCQCHGTCNIENLRVNSTRLTRGREYK